MTLKMNLLDLSSKPDITYDDLMIYVIKSLVIFKNNETLYNFYLHLMKIRVSSLTTMFVEDYNPSVKMFDVVCLKDMMSFMIVEETNVVLTTSEGEEMTKQNGVSGSLKGMGQYVFSPRSNIMKIGSLDYNYALRKKAEHQKVRMDVWSKAFIELGDVKSNKFFADRVLSSFDEKFVSVYF